MAPDATRKSERSAESHDVRAFQTHTDDSPTGLRRYINILAISIPIVVGLVVVLVIVRSLREPAAPTARSASSSSTSSSDNAPAAGSSQAGNAAPKAISAAAPSTPASSPAVAVAATRKPTLAQAASADVVVDLPADEARAMTISEVKPVNYADIRGTVVLAVTISKSGTVDEVRAVSGPAVLVPVSIAAVKKWRYRPYLINGKPVRFHTQIAFVFN